MREASPRTQASGTAKARAPGKIILTGEHFVVLGAPAVATAISLYAHAKVEPSADGRIEVGAAVPLRLIGKEERGSSRLDTHKLLEPLRLAAEATLEHIGRRGRGVSVEAECQIPVGAGLGSSASTTVAIISAVARAQGSELARDEIFNIAFTPESYLHGKPSGVDQAACTFGGTIQYATPGAITPLKIKRGPLILVCDTGVHRSTKGLVGAVVRKSRRETRDFQSHLREIAEISEGAAKALKKGDDDQLGWLMNRNQDLLVEIGVSHPSLDRLVKVAREAGALGAKLTGAGGGGCMIALCRDEKARETISRALRREGGIPYKVTVDVRGVEASDDWDRAQIGSPVTGSKSVM